MIGDTAARAELYRGWHAAHRMGATHPDALAMIELRHSPTVEALRAQLLAQTRGGNSITSVVTEHAGLVDAFERAVLIAGEESGTLEQTLASLAAHFTDEYRFVI